MQTFASIDPRPLQQQRAAAVRRLAQRLQLLVEQAHELAAQIRDLAVLYAPLPTSGGVDLLTAGTHAGLLGPGLRVARAAPLAAYAGAGTGSSTPSSIGSP